MDRHRDAQRHHEAGGQHKVEGRLAEAEVEFRAALALDPDRADTRYSLGQIALAEGRYAEGFALDEFRHAVPVLQNPKPHLPFPEWRGEDVAGRKVLIWIEQGFGDQIQAARFAPILRDRGAEVTLVCAPALASLFEDLGVRIVAASGAVSFDDPDYWVMGGSLAGRLGYGPDTLPAAPYLGPPLAPRGGPFTIGLATAGDPRHPNDTYRSLGREDAARLRDLPARTVSLHPADTGAKTFRETAEIVAGLDLVISVDTSIAHLAGAMGQAVWTLVPAFNTDWRWMRDRSDSPWYPSMRLYRQAVAGDWSDLLTRVIADATAVASRLQAEA